MSTPSLAGPVTRDLELEALQRAVRWPNPDPRSVVALAGRFLARGHDQAGFAYFRERAAARPDEPLFQSLAGLFQLRLVAEQPAAERAGWLREGLTRLDAAAATPGLTTYFRGIALAGLPAQLGRTEAAVADLESVIGHPDQFPVGFRRPVYQALAGLYAAQGRDADARAALERSGSARPTDEAVFTADYWCTAQDGFHFGPPRLLELAPRVYVAQGYDLADFAFVLTDDGIAAIDSGTTEAHAEAALQALRAVSDQPIRLVILTHAHWDHIGGVPALATPGTSIIAQAGFADELRLVNETGVPYRMFFAGQAKPEYRVMREHVVKRIYHARTGYWKPDGEGVDVFAPDEWAAALTLLADGREEAFVRSAGALLEGDAEALALRLVDLSLRGFPDSQPQRELRRRALNQLRAVHQQLNPFKFAVYSEWAKAELLPVA